MNPLTVNSETGFLESTSPNFHTFDSEKKKTFLELSLRSAQKGEWPDINALCRQLQVSVGAFYYHKNRDELFRDAWEEVKRTVSHEITKTMHEFSKQPKNYMDRITLQRHLYPEEWGGERKEVTLNDVEWLKKLGESLKSSAVDAVVVDNTSTVLKDASNLKEKHAELSSPSENMK